MVSTISSNNKNRALNRFVQDLAYLDFKKSFRKAFKEDNGNNP
jgi:hypothetical protein